MKAHVITLCYAPGPVIRAGLKSLYETVGLDLQFDHYLVHQHYPLNPSDTELAMWEAVRDYDCHILDSGRSLGLHGGLNFAVSQIKPGQGDIIIIYDPDSSPVDVGWGQALAVALWNGGLSVAGLVTDGINTELRERFGSSRLVDGYLKVTEPRHACALTVCGFRYDFVSQAGGFQEPNAHYGGLECAMWAHLKGRKWGYVTGYREDGRHRAHHDPEYIHWKLAHAHTGAWPGSFESFIEAGCPGFAGRPRGPAP